MGVRMEIRAGRLGNGHCGRPRGERPTFKRDPRGGYEADCLSAGGDIRAMSVRSSAVAIMVAVTLASPAPALAEGGTINAADTAWMISATGLVLMMSIPGLALFYCGMVRKKNVLAT